MEKPHVLLAVSGGIAAYKAIDVVSRLVKAGVEVKVIETRHAMEFIPPISFETLSHNKVETSLFDPANSDPIAHISLAKWADLFAVVPASANILAKMAHGIADDLVSTTFLAVTCPVLVFPAMNVHMYENTATQSNLALLASRGIQVIEPVSGHLACDDTGKGKLPDPADIVQTIMKALHPVKQVLKGHKVLISAGPTQEAMDPVRFISNHSSGKQGYAIAQAAKDLGAETVLISGPCSIKVPEGVKTIDVISARDMFEAVKKESADADYIIMAAAVGDYRPKTVSDQKIKKKDDEMVIELERNPDILAWLGEHKKENQVLCGFAMETQNLLENARTKLEKKNCDLLIANNLFTAGAGFSGDTNVVTVLTPQGMQELEKCSKLELGEKILKTMNSIEKEKKHADGH